MYSVCLCVCLSVRKPRHTVSSWYFWLGPAQKLDPLPSPQWEQETEQELPPPCGQVMSGKGNRQESKQTRVNRTVANLT